mmetsp:Transcript_14371/g.21836  ORF Transcript_14371/g.21836 Transcript_14371/m.21836 type:complete len:210 (+) Transcript_14371:23-652(+)
MGVRDGVGVPLLRGRWKRWRAPMGALAMTAAMIFVVVYNFGGKKNLLGFCCGSAKVEQWDQLLGVLKTTKYKDNPDICKQLDRMTNSMSGKCKRFFAIMYASEETRAMSQLGGLSNVAKMLEAEVTKIQKDTDMRVHAAELDSRRECEKLEMACDELTERATDFNRNKMNREKDTKERHDKFQVRLQGIKDEIERLQGLISKEKDIKSN